MSALPAWCQLHIVRRCIRRGWRRRGRVRLHYRWKSSKMPSWRRTSPGPGAGLWGRRQVRWSARTRHWRAWDMISAKLSRQPSIEWLYAIGQRGQADAFFLDRCVGEAHRARTGSGSTRRSPWSVRKGGSSLLAVGLCVSKQAQRERNSEAQQETPPRGLWCRRGCGRGTRQPSSKARWLAGA